MGPRKKFRLAGRAAIKAVQAVFGSQFGGLDASSIKDNLETPGWFLRVKSEEGYTLIVELTDNLREFMVFKEHANGKLLRWTRCSGSRRPAHRRPTPLG